MRVITHPRSTIYEVLKAAFDALTIQPTCVEVGVLKGDNAESINRVMCPSKLILVDSWSNLPMLDSEAQWQGKPWIVAGHDPKIISYFGGSPREQSTFDHLYSLVRTRFQNKPNVQIIKKNSIAYYYDAIDLGLKGRIDYVYLDANHSYETVFQELMLYQNLLREDGCIQLNDCCHSGKGIEQNLGVLEAVLKFIKVSQYYPVFLTNSDWSDILLVREHSRIKLIIEKISEDSNMDFVEVPAQILGSARVIYGLSRKRISFL